jgi:DNA repair photolyase
MIFNGFLVKNLQVGLKNEYVAEHIEGLDEPLLTSKETKIYYEHAKTIVNKITSPDLGMTYSLNPYQGCEHGCTYCYARNTHENFGFDAGMDFENKIMVKENAPELLTALFHKPSWQASPISVSGNTDCYQPLERKMEITRKLLKVFLQYRHPVGMITKNSLILRDLDILQGLAKENLIHVYISITTLEENLRRAMEPRTASGIKRLQTIEQLTKAGIPVVVMNAPIIPGLNDHEIPTILKAAADHGAVSAGMTMVRLNGSVGIIFQDWIEKNFPDRAEKVLHQIQSMHGGNLNDSQFGRRMKGEGKIAEIISLLFSTSKRKYFHNRSFPAYDLTKFRKGGNLNLF